MAEDFLQASEENTTYYENEKKYDEILMSVLEELYEGLTSSNLFLFFIIFLVFPIFYDLFVLSFLIFFKKITSMPLLL